MIPPPAAGGASIMSFQISPNEKYCLGTAEAGLVMSLCKGAGQGSAGRRSLRQVVG